MFFEHQHPAWMQQNFLLPKDFAQALSADSKTLTKPEEVEKLTLEEYGRNTRGGRVWVVRGLSLAEEQCRSSDAIAILQLIKPIAFDLYDHPVSERAKQLLHDDQGNSYDHWGEMLRDQAEFYLVAHKLYRDERLVKMAMVGFQRAVRGSSLDESVGLALVQQGLLRLSQNYPPYNSSSEREFSYREYVQRGFELALNPIKAAQDIGRLAWLTNIALDPQNISEPSFRQLTQKLFVTAQREFVTCFGPLANQVRIRYLEREVILSDHRSFWWQSKQKIPVEELDILPALYA